MLIWFLDSSSHDDSINIVQRALGRHQASKYTSRICWDHDRLFCHARAACCFPPVSSCWGPYAAPHGGVGFVLVALMRTRGAVLTFILDETKMLLSAQRGMTRV